MAELGFEDWGRLSATKGPESAISVAIPAAQGFELRLERNPPLAGDEPLYAEYEDALVGIVVGERFPGWERPAAIEAGRKVGIEPLIMDWTMGKPTPTTLQRTPNQAAPILVTPGDRGENVGEDVVALDSAGRD